MKPAKQSQGQGPRERTWQSKRVQSAVNRGLVWKLVAGSWKKKDDVYGEVYEFKE
jgi:hypothetical protein